MDQEEMNEKFFARINKLEMDFAVFCERVSGQIDGLAEKIDRSQAQRTADSAMVKRTFYAVIGGVAVMLVGVILKMAGIG